MRRESGKFKDTHIMQLIPKIAETEHGIKKSNTKPALYSCNDSDLEYAEFESLFTLRKLALPTSKNHVDKMLTNRKKSPSHEETAISHSLKKLQKQRVFRSVSYFKDSATATATATVAPTMGLLPSASHEFAKQI